MPWGLVILTLSIFAFIASMTAVLRNFFCGRDRWFLFLLVCVVISSIWMGMELYRFLAPNSYIDDPLNLRPVQPL